MSKLGKMSHGKLPQLSSNRKNSPFKREQAAKAFNAIGIKQEVYFHIAAVHQSGNGIKHARMEDPAEFYARMIACNIRDFIPSARKSLVALNKDCESNRASLAELRRQLKLMEAAQESEAGSLASRASCC